MNWDAAQAKTWEAQHGTYPTVAMALGTKYVELKQWIDAERCFKKYIAVSPDLAGYEALANVYHQQGEDDRSLVTLKEYLQQPDYGLQHAEADQKIADYYMDQGLFPDALPFAEDAGSTEAAWGIQCEVAAHAGMGDWDKAESRIHDMIEHYSMDPYAWYSWCIRTGHGSRDAAGSALDAYLSTLGARTTDANRLEGLTLAIVEHHPERAMRYLRERMALLAGPTSGLHIAMLADEAHDAPTRDEAIQESIDHCKNAEALGHYATLLRDAFQAGPEAMPDLAKIDELASTSIIHYAIEMDYCTAIFLDHRGRHAQALDYLRKCAGKTTKDDRNFFEVILADAALRDRGLDPLELERAARPSHQVSLYP